jgi:hypothetical protein
MFTGGTSGVWTAGTSGTLTPPTSGVWIGGVSGTGTPGVLNDEIGCSGALPPLSSPVAIPVNPTAAVKQTAAIAVSRPNIDFPCPVSRRVPHAPVAGTQ